MTDLQLGLLAIGVVAVVAVLAFNKLQERRAARAAQRAFGSGHTDVLLNGNGSPRDIPARPAAQVEAALPDEKVDYVMLLRSPVGVPAGAVLEAWHSIEQRFARRVLLA